MEFKEFKESPMKPGNLKKFLNGIDASNPERIDPRDYFSSLCTRYKALVAPDEGALKQFYTLLFYSAKTHSEALPPSIKILRKAFDFSENEQVLYGTALTLPQARRLFSCFGYESENENLQYWRRRFKRDFNELFEDYSQRLPPSGNTALITIAEYSAVTGFRKSINFPDEIMASKFMDFLDYGY